MNHHDDLKLLLGGYATGTLTPAEREKLFAAALENQEIFDALADEQALKELLDDPESRGYLREALHESTARPLEDQPHLMRMSAAAAAPIPRPPTMASLAPPARKQSGFRYAYPALAAVIVVGTSVGAWFYMRSPEQPPSVASVATTTKATQAPSPAESVQSQPAQSQPAPEQRLRREEPRPAAPPRAAAAEPVKAKDEVRRDQAAPAAAAPPPPPPAPVVEQVATAAAESEAKAVAAAAPKPAPPSPPPPAYSLRRRNPQGEFVAIPRDTHLTEGDEIEIVLPTTAGLSALADARQEVAAAAPAEAPSAKKEAFAKRSNSVGAIGGSGLGARAQVSADRAKAAPAPASPPPPAPKPANRFTLKAGENVLSFAGREIRLQAAPKNP